LRAPGAGGIDDVGGNAMSVAASEDRVEGVKDPRLGRSRLARDIFRDRYLYFLVIPIILWFLIFRYIPMYGVIIAFKDFRFADGIFGSEWVGLMHFERMFRSQDFFQIVRNTLVLNLYQLIFQFPAPIILALMLNEVRNRLFKKTTQTLLYVPHFMSWVVMAGVVVSILSPTTGIVNILLNRILGVEPIHFMVQPGWWVFWFIVSGVWKTAGFGTIIYLAAITSIDPQLYEAATIDGAGKFRKMWSITLPALAPTVAILLILNLGNFIEIGFEQVHMLMNSAVYSVADVIPTYVYRVGLRGAQFSYTAGVGFFQALVGLILITATNWVLKRLGYGGLW
jgi:putative aldouronate transport system permease protein